MKSHPGQPSFRALALSAALGLAAALSACAGGRQSASPAPLTSEASHAAPPASQAMLVENTPAESLPAPPPASETTLPDAEVTPHPEPVWSLPLEDGEALHVYVEDPVQALGIFGTGEAYVGGVWGAYRGDLQRVGDELFYIKRGENSQQYRALHTTTGQDRLVHQFADEDHTTNVVRRADGSMLYVRAAPYALHEQKSWFACEIDKGDWEVMALDAPGATPYPLAGRYPKQYTTGDMLYLDGDVYFGGNTWYYSNNYSQPLALRADNTMDSGVAF